MHSCEVARTILNLRSSIKQLQGGLAQEQETFWNLLPNLLLLLLNISPLDNEYFARYFLKSKHCKALPNFR